MVMDMNYLPPKLRRSILVGVAVAAALVTLFFISDTFLSTALALPALECVCAVALVVSVVCIVYAVRAHRTDALVASAVVAVGLVVLMFMLVPYLRAPAAPLRGAPGTEDCLIMASFALFVVCWVVATVRSIVRGRGGRRRVDWPWMAPALVFLVIGAALVML